MDCAALGMQALNLTDLFLKCSARSNMGGKTTLLTTLVYCEENCAPGNLRLDKLSAIRSDIEQFFSWLRNKFKYLQTESHAYSQLGLRGNREKMTATAISKEGASDAC